MRGVENIQPAPASIPAPPFTQAEPNSPSLSHVELGSPLPAPCTRDQGTQTSLDPDVSSIGVQTVSLEPFQDCEPTGELTSTTEKLSEVSWEVGLVHDFSVRVHLT